MEQTVTAVAAPAPRLPAANDLLARAWQIYQDKFRKFLEIYWRGLIGAAPFLVVAFLLFLTSTLATRANLKLPLLSLLIVLGVVVFLGFIYYAVRTQIGLMLYFERSESVPAQEVFSDTKNYFWRFLGVTLLNALLVLLWGLLFIIPGVVFSIYYTFGTMVLLFEGLAAKAALNRSQELVRGYWWAVLGRFILLGLIYMVLALVLSVPNLWLPLNSVYSAVWGGIVQVINFLIGPLFGVYSYLIYKNLVAIKVKSN